MPGSCACSRLVFSISARSCTSNYSLGKRLARSERSRRGCSAQHLNCRPAKAICTLHAVRMLHTTSKHSLLQVKVWLGKGFKHYYVLSRFLTSRMLTVTKIKPTKVGVGCHAVLAPGIVCMVTWPALLAVLQSTLLASAFCPAPQVCLYMGLTSTSAAAGCKNSTGTEKVSS